MPSDRATELGYAESDPTADVEGYDAGRKIAIMASLAFIPGDFFTGIYRRYYEDHSRRYPLCEKGIRLCNQALGVARHGEDGIEVKSTSHADQ